MLRHHQPTPSCVVPRLLPKLERRPKGYHPSPTAHATACNCNGSIVNIWTLAAQMVFHWWPCCMQWFVASLPVQNYNDHASFHHVHADVVGNGGTPLDPTPGDRETACVRFSLSSSSRIVGCAMEGCENKLGPCNITHGEC